MLQSSIVQGARVANGIFAYPGNRRVSSKKTKAARFPSSGTCESEDVDKRIYRGEINLVS